MMSYPCGIIRDLLPLYLDEVCNEESREAVEGHLIECEACKKYYEAMKSVEGFIEKKNENLEDMRMADSLKKVKNKINQKTRMVLLCAVLGVLFFVGGFYLLFEAALKEISLEEVLISAEVYSLEELIENPVNDVPDSESVTILDNENDNSQTVNVNIPNLGRVILTENLIERNKFATVISVSSEYFLRAIEWEINDKIIYIKGFKTTFLNNKAENYQKQSYSLEFQEINQIVFVEENGVETVLWSREE